MNKEKNKRNAPKKASKPSKLIKKFDAPQMIRDIILCYIIKNENVDYIELKEDINLQERRLTFHINQLLKNEYIGIIYQNNKKIYFPLPKGGKNFKNFYIKHIIIITTIKLNNDSTQSEIRKIIKMPQSTVSRILKDLRRADLVNSRFDDNGVRRYYFNDIDKKDSD